MTIFHFNLLKRPIIAASICVFAILTAMTAMAQVISVPSGQPLSFLEFISERDGEVVRFRFLTPEIGKTYVYGDIIGDFQVLCDEQVMPVLEVNAMEPRQIVLSMSAVDIPFGEDNAEVLQFFEIFRPEGGICIWEEF